MDLETRTINDIMVPYCVSIFDGKTPTSFYLSDFSDSDEMLKSAVQFIMKPKFHNHKIYLHNFSFFDGIFLIKILSQLTDVIIKPLMRDGRIIELKFTFTIASNNFNIYFRDSYLILPSSLRKLATNFNVEAKGAFPSCPFWRSRRIRSVARTGA
jgi:DNA polymerase type B, organellar and viral